MMILKYAFKATLIKNDERTGYNAGKIFYPKGFYYNKKNIIIVGDINTDSTVRLSFPMDIMEVIITEE